MSTVSELRLRRRLLARALHMAPVLNNRMVRLFRSSHRSLCEESPRRRAIFFCYWFSFLFPLLSYLKNCRGSRELVEFELFLFLLLFLAECLSRHRAQATSLLPTIVLFPTYPSIRGALESFRNTGPIINYNNGQLSLSRFL